jgi:hypothetical protein
MNDVLATRSVIEDCGLETAMLTLADAVYEDRVFISVTTDTAAIHIVPRWLAAAIAVCD